MKLKLVFKRFRLKLHISKALAQLSHPDALGLNNTRNVVGCSLLRHPIYNNTKPALQPKGVERIETCINYFGTAVALASLPCPVPHTADGLSGQPHSSLASHAATKLPCPHADQSLGDHARKHASRTWANMLPISCRRVGPAQAVLEGQLLRRPKLSCQPRRRKSA